MDKIYVLSESTSDRIPEQLAVLVSRLPKEANEEDLFLGLVFHLALETGFQVPDDEDAIEWFLRMLSRKTFHRWAFAGQVNITTEFVRSQSGLVAIVTGLVQRFSQSCCFKVSEFVPRPQDPSAAMKFANLCDLSVQLRSLFWLCRIETKSDGPHPEKAAFENLPSLVLDNIAFFLPKLKK